MSSPTNVFGSSPVNVFDDSLKIFFSAYGYRKVKSWSCDQCNAFFTCGADIAVDESIAHHLTECPRLRLLKISKLKEEIKNEILKAEIKNEILKAKIKNEILKADHEKEKHESSVCLRYYYVGQRHALENLLSFLESQ